MSLEIGTTLYLYTIRTGKFNVYKGEVVYWPHTFTGRYKVAFEKRQAKEWCPDPNEIGVLRTNGPRIWMMERDDNKAREMFLEYEKSKLPALEDAVANKKAVIKMLESMMMES